LKFLVEVEHPALFSAVPFEMILDLLITAKLDEAKRTQQTPEKALLDWKIMTNGATKKMVESES
jgi:hypothetical protein